jgi:hypothetical protein
LQFNHVYLTFKRFVRVEWKNCQQYERSGTDFPRESVLENSMAVKFDVFYLFVQRGSGSRFVKELDYLVIFLIQKLIIHNSHKNSHNAAHCVGIPGVETSNQPVVTIRVYFRPSSKNLAFFQFSQYRISFGASSRSPTLRFQ